MIFNKLNKRNYIYLSITMLMLSLYIVFFPFFAKILNGISPNLTKCVYRSITGKPCPLCGGTRFIAGIKENLTNISYFNSFFGYMIVFIFFEIIFRIFCIIYTSISKDIKKLVVLDILIHLLCFILFITYEVLFIIIT